MNDDDPYRSPQADLHPPGGALPRPSTARDVADGISTDNTIMPRYFAASVDYILAIILSLLAARSMGEDSPTLQVVALLATFLGYFFFFEGFASRTPGKFIAGLVVVQTDGRPCTWWQVFIRTILRVLEVNPIFLGGLPAARVHRVFEASPAIRRQARPDHCRSARPGRALPRFRNRAFDVTQPLIPTMTADEFRSLRESCAGELGKNGDWTSSKPRKNAPIPVGSRGNLSPSLHDLGVSDRRSGQVVALTRLLSCAALSMYTSVAPAEQDSTSSRVGECDSSVFSPTALCHSRFFAIQPDAAIVDAAERGGLALLVARPGEIFVLLACIVQQFGSGLMHEVDRGPLRSHQLHVTAGDLRRRAWYSKPSIPIDLATAVKPSDSVVCSSRRVSHLFEAGVVGQLGVFGHRELFPTILRLSRNTVP